MKQHFFKPPVLMLSAALLISAAINTGCKSKATTTTAGTSTDDALAIPALFERKGELAKADEWQKTKEKITELNQKITKSASDVKARLQVAAIYMAEARITGEHPYYYPAINKVLDGVLALDSKNFEALVYKASVKMSQHQFTQAKQIAEKALTINADNAYVYGVLVDANVELGNYEEAVRMSDKMQALKPSLESYSRASYLREIYGDYPGAVDAMTMAVKAGLPGSEPWCWSKKTLAHLYEKTGKWDDASKQYEEILAVRPSYAFALEGLAKVEKQKKNYSKALELLDKAVAIMPEFSFHEEMADIYELQGEKEKAAKKYAEVITMLEEDAKSGHSVSLEMCRVYTKAGIYDKAMEQAMDEYSARPHNIDVNLAMAWASFKNNDAAKANEYIKAAMRTGSKDPDMMEKVKMIGKKG